MPLYIKSVFMFKLYFIYRPKLTYFFFFFKYQQNIFKVVLLYLYLTSENSIRIFSQKIK